jgi:hypothetical protein
VLALTLLGAALAPAGASAQDDGVTVDPGSPTGREYAIPLDQARREAGAGTAQRNRSSSSGGDSTSSSAGGGGSDASDKASDPHPGRFGQGITSAAPRRTAAPRRRRPAVRRAVAPPVVATRGVTEVKPSGSGLDSGVLLALGVVGLGAVVGLGVRLLRRGASPA